MCIHKAPKNHPKSKKVSNYGSRTASLKKEKCVCCVRSVAFRKNNPYCDPTDVTVTLLICVRE